MNCLAVTVEGELADKVSLTPWVIFGDDDTRNTFTTVCTIKKDVDETMLGYKQHFELRLKEFEKRLAPLATIEQCNDISKWVAEIDGILENNVRPMLERQQKELLRNNESLSKIGNLEASQDSPLSALQLRLATSVAAGPETAIGEIREMLFTGVALTEDKPALREAAEMALQRLQGVGGSRLNRAAMWDIVSPVCTGKPARKLFKAITDAVKSYDDERKRESGFKFKTYNHAAKSRPTNADLAARNSVVSVSDQKADRKKTSKKRRSSVCDPKRFREMQEEEHRQHIPSDDEEVAPKSSGSGLWVSRKDAINKKLAKVGLIQASKARKRRHSDSDDEQKMIDKVDSDVQSSDSSESE